MAATTIIGASTLEQPDFELRIELVDSLDNAICEAIRRLSTLLDSLPERLHVLNKPVVYWPLSQLV